jgi:alkylation response protein AidB-like acyl-CoA dehydrogenase
MALAVDPTPTTVQTDVCAWFDANWDPELSLIEWRRRFVDSGWAVPSWPEQNSGLGLPGWADELVRREISNVGAVGLPVGPGLNLAAPTILAHGSEELRERFLRPTLTGEFTWCQLFSEPGAGSDLAGLTTSAQLDGEEWVINGQKVWTTNAHHADFGILLARSNWEAPKHGGLSYFIIPMRQPGIEIRQLREMNHHASFNEVFFTDARLPRSWVVGGVGDGWKVALTTLAFERRFGTIPRPRYRSKGRAAEEAREEAAAHFSTYSWYPQRAGRADIAIEQARAAGLSKDPVIRQELARLECMLRASRWTANRARENLSLGRTPGPEGSIGKLAASLVAHQASKVHSMIAGAHGMLTGTESLLGGVIAEIFVSVPAQSIAGGTDELQRNIIAERQLGLPREPALDLNRPFRDVLRNGAGEITEKQPSTGGL